MRRFFGGVIAVIVSLIVSVVFTFGTGRYDVAARRPPDAMDKFGDWVKSRSVPARAGDQKVPGVGDAASVRKGLEHYATNCLPCHGAPGIEGMEFHEGMFPPPPEIGGQQVQHWSDGELFWIVKNGIRMTGMPAFGASHYDEEIAQIVAFVRHVPKISSEERETLEKALPHEHHHGAEEKGEETHEPPHGQEL